MSISIDKRPPIKVHDDNKERLDRVIEAFEKKHSMKLKFATAVNMAVRLGLEKLEQENGVASK